MVVRIFYNQKAFPNVVLLRLNDDLVDKYEKKGKVTKLWNAKKVIIGYNIEEQIVSTQDGYQKMDANLLNKLNNEIENTFHEKVEHDFNEYILVGKVITCRPHPDSDHLYICEVDIKKETLQIVCGASNVREGIKVVVACINAVLPSGTLIQPGKLRGVESYGMLCSEYELGLIKEKKKGILILDENFEIGSKFI